MVTEAEELSPEELEADRSPDNAGNPTAVGRKKRAAKQVEKTQNMLLSDLLATTSGRELFRWLIFDVCGVHATTETAAYDNNAMHFREGARNVGFIIERRCIAANAPQYATLFREHVIKDQG